MQVSFCGIALKTANDCPSRDPRAVQFYIATPDNEWKHIRSVSFKENSYNRYSPILTYTQSYRTHAILIHVANDGKSEELQLSEIILYNEINKEQ